MGRAQRDKGKRGERELAQLLREHGYDDAHRGVQYQGGPQSPDVVGMPGVHLEVKRTERPRIYDYMGQAIRDAGDGEIPVVAHRQNGKRWLAILPFEDFVEMRRKIDGAQGSAEDHGDHAGQPDQTEHGEGA